MIKYIVAFDTLCTGWSCVKDEYENPVLFDSPDEAWREIMDGAESRLQAIEQGDVISDPVPEITNQTRARMSELRERGSAEEIILFFNEYPELNDSEEFVVSETEYQEGKKTILSFS
jgi:hypothetical protein